MSEARTVRAPYYSKDQLEYLADQHTEAFSRYDGTEDPGFSAWKFAAHYMGKTVRFEWLSNYIFKKGVTEMLDVRNSDGRLVCQIDEKTGNVVIKTKNCKTIIKHKPDSSPEIINIKT